MRIIDSNKFLRVIIAANQESEHNKDVVLAVL